MQILADDGHNSATVAALKIMVQDQLGTRITHLTMECLEDGRLGVGARLATGRILAALVAQPATVADVAKALVSDYTEGLS